MPLRFASARSPARSPVARALQRSALEMPANDCGPFDRDPVLEAAVRHFAEHGLGSVASALAEADRAADPTTRERWLAVCAMFDPRAAAAARGNTR